MGQAEDGDIQGLDGLAGLQPLGEGVLILDVHLQIGHHAQHGQMGLFLQHGKAGAEDLHVPTEFIDDKALDAGTLVGFQQLHGAVELGEDAAAVDVARQQHRRVHQLRQPHVHDVVGLQVDLRRAPGPFDHDDVHGFGKAVVGREDVRDEGSLHFKVGGGGHLAPHFAVYDDLTAHVAAGLEQDGVHPHVGLDARRLGLYHLCPAHFQPVAGDKAVQRHVLTFEGGGAVAVLRKNAAERRAEQTFARAAHGSLHHDAACFAHRITSARVFSSRSFSGPVRTAVRYQLASRPG